MRNLIFIVIGGLAGALHAQTIVEGLGAEEFGRVLLAADFDLDKKVDLVIGAPRHTPDERTHAGRIVIVQGGKEGVAAKKTPWLGAHSSDKFGTSLAAGDLDGDQAPDLIVGAPGFERSRGLVYILRGGIGGGEALSGGDLRGGGFTLELGGSAAMGSFGKSVAVGDLDGDGLSELIVGEASVDVNTRVRAGRVLVFKGRKTWTGPKAKVGEGDYIPDLIVVGLEQTDLGSAVFVSDLNGDGLDDLVAMTPFAMNAGRKEAGLAAVIFGKKDLLQKQTLVLDKDEPDVLIVGAGEGRAGATAAAIDLDGDGTKELLLAEPGRGNGNTARAGALFAINLKAAKKRIDLGRQKENPLPALRGTAANEEYATAFFVGACDGASRMDILVASPSAVRVALYSEISAFEATTTPTRVLTPSGGARSFGTSLAAGDLNGDGQVEIAVGAPEANKVFLF